MNEPATSGDDAAKEKAALETGARAVTYGLPLVLIDITMQTSINTVRGSLGPTGLNQFVNMRAFPTAAFKTIVRANVDTLYSTQFDRRSMNELSVAAQSLVPRPPIVYRLVKTRTGR